MAELELSTKQRADLILEACKKESGINPIEMFRTIAKNDFVSIHGPEHHILDGAVILTAFHNAGGDLDLSKALNELSERGLEMPGATCGLWGVCGSVTSIGAALSIIDGTDAVSTDGTWGSHMKYTSKALNALAEVGGPRCCKRDAFLALLQAIEHINSNYNVSLESEKIQCEFSKYNQQCIGIRCPFHKNSNKKLQIL